MKKLFTLLGVLAAPLGLWADSKIQMVTYFPVPYVAYSKVNATDQMDIGLTTSCIMNLGCTESGNAGLRPLNVTNTVLKKGRLDLNTATAVSGSTASIGSGSGSGSMNFSSNLRVNTLNDGLSVEANNITVDTLKLFPNRITTDFPSCASTGAPGTPNISWQKLKLKDKEEVYLMCGNAKNAGCDPSSKPSTPTPITCNTCGTQNGTVSCDESTGKWKITWSSCSVSSPSQCATYSWKRYSSMDCVFDPASPSYYDCSLYQGGGGADGSAGSLGPFSVGSGCSTVASVARAWGYNPVNIASSPMSGTCSESDSYTLYYYHATYNGISLGAKYTMGCVAYTCQRD